MLKAFSNTTLQHPHQPMSYQESIWQLGLEGGRVKLDTLKLS